MKATKKLCIIMAQLDFLVGDIEGNAEKIISQAKHARDDFHADLIVFPELTLTGYPPEDLLFRPALYDRVEKAIDHIAQQMSDITIILGYPERTDTHCYNAAVVLQQNKRAAFYRKQHLPNYQVFDEMRYFQPGNQRCTIDVNGIRTAITICEDLWHPEPMQQAMDAGAHLMISINASPFEKEKLFSRQETIIARAQEGKMPIIYVNLVGAQDELVFDGGSLVVDGNGDIKQRAPYFEEALLPVHIEMKDALRIKAHSIPKSPTLEHRVYQSLVLGIRDYVEKNCFPGIVIGLSGGIDSSLTLALAVDALGKERVEALMMPSPYTSDFSMSCAAQQAALLGVHYRKIPIDTIFNAYLEALAEEFLGLEPDTTEENIQARIRGVLLMAVSNKKGALVLSTGNKSEMSVGYATLYGDMVGGFCALKDIPKTLVYKLCEYRNSVSRVIPQEIIDRPPSAELAHNQQDQDTLPPYEILDDILERYIGQDQSNEEIIAAGFDKGTVNRVINMVNRNEYKRRQAPPGVRISRRAFGRDRRYPITSGYCRQA